MSKLTAFIVCTLVFLLAFGGTVYMHEQVHINICNYFGAETDGVIHFDIYKAWVEIEHLENPQYQLAHSINDVVGYHVNGILIMLYFICLTIIAKGEEK